MKSFAFGFLGLCVVALVLALVASDAKACPQNVFVQQQQAFAVFVPQQVVLQQVFVPQPVFAQVNFAAASQVSFSQANVVLAQEVGCSSGGCRQNVRQRSVRQSSRTVVRQRSR